MKAYYSGRKPSRIYPHIHVFDSLLPVWEDRQGQNGRMDEWSKSHERLHTRKGGVLECGNIGGSNPSPSAIR